MNKNGFIFAPLGVIAAGLLMTFAHAGTITVSDFSNPARAISVLKSTESLVLTDKSGTISAACGEHKMGIPPFFTFSQDNAYLVKHCPTGLIVKMTNEGYKQKGYINAFKIDKQSCK